MIIAYLTHCKKNPNAPYNVFKENGVFSLTWPASMQIY